jgi:solute carrier family 35 protein E3
MCVSCQHHTTTKLTAELRTFSDPQLRNCQISTTTYHFATTFILLYLSSTPPAILRDYYKPIFSPRWLPLRSVLPICILFASFLILGNLSLTYNSVSFFQLAKILTVPTVVLLNFVLFRKTISLQKLATVAIACLGVALATGANAKSNPLGTALAVAAFCSTAMYQIYIGKMLLAPIDGVEVNASQLLMNQTMVSSVMLVCLIPFFDRRPEFSKS